MCWLWEEEELVVKTQEQEGALGLWLITVVTNLLQEHLTHLYWEMEELSQVVLLHVVIQVMTVLFQQELQPCLLPKVVAVVDPLTMLAQIVVAMGALQVVVQPVTMMLLVPLE